MPGVQVRSLVRELKGHVPLSQKKKKTQNIKQEQYCKKLIKTLLKWSTSKKKKKTYKMKELEGIVLSEIS